MGGAVRIKFGTVALGLQGLFILLFAVLTEYDWRAHPVHSDEHHHAYTNNTNDAVHESSETTSSYVGRKYPPFQDVHVMIFVGFGFLMTFLRKYGFSAVSINMFLASLLIQWAMIVRGFVYEGILKGNKFQVRLDEMVTADFATATVLISFGAVLGRTSPLQLLVMGLVEVVAAQINGYLCNNVLHAIDVGESMYIHAFGAYFGLAVSRILYNQHAQNHQKADSSYHSDLFSMIGTVFLWLYWPSFNGGGSNGDEQHRAYINTYLSLCACTVVTFGITALYDKRGKFTMVFIQNATLAGGVAVGTAANMPMQPFGAIIVGCIAGAISCTGYRYITDYMAEKLKIQDTCGVHNLHGMPGVLAAIVGMIMALVATQEGWGRSLYEIFPLRMPEPDNVTDTFKAHFPHLDYDQGTDRSGGSQALYQLLALIVTLCLAIGSGIITGLILKINVLDQVHNEQELFEDVIFWNVPEIQESGSSETAILHNSDGKSATPLTSTAEEIKA